MAQASFEVQTSPGAPQEPAALSPPFSRDRTRFDLPVPPHAAVVRVAALLSPPHLPPGWRLRVNGRPVAHAELGPPVLVPRQRGALAAALLGPRSALVTDRKSVV